MIKKAVDPRSLMLKEAQRLFNAKQFAQAEVLLRSVLAARPEHPGGLHLLGMIAFAAHQYDDAAELLRRALPQQRSNAHLHNHLGRALQAQGRLEEAIRSMRHAVSLSPGTGELHLNLGSALMDSGALDAALASLTRATALDPAHAQAHFIRALCLFALGRIDEAWTEYAWRDSTADASATPGVSVQRPFNAPPADLRGKRILILGEQGLGDELFFLRYAPLLKSLGAWLAYRGSPRLAPLLAGAAWLDAIVEPDASPPAHDIAVCVGDLAQLARDGRAGLPGALALSVQPRAQEAARKRLAACGPPPYLGVTWRAGREALAGEPRRLPKSVPLERFALALSHWRGTAVVLQRAPLPGEIESFAALSGLPTADFSESNGDLEQMLGLLDAIDEYVGVSNTNTHLRAGLGLRARVLIAFPPEWRWMSSTERSPWFPGFPLYREDRVHGWDGALQRLRDETAG